MDASEFLRSGILDFTGDVQECKDSCCGDGSGYGTGWGEGAGYGWGNGIGPGSGSGFGSGSGAGRGSGDERRLAYGC